MKRKLFLSKYSPIVIVLILSTLVTTNNQVLAQASGIKNILLVHGTFADGSGWEGVYKILTAKGYRVTVVQNPCSSLEEDVAAVRRAMDRETGLCILVGHSYGGSIITEAGSDDRVAGLVYVDGFIPDSGEAAAINDPSIPDLTDGAILPPDAAGLVYMDDAKFHACFCADLPLNHSAFMSAAQVPGSVKAFTAVVRHAPWKTKPSWAVLGTEDKAINPILLRKLYKRAHAKVTEIKGASHVSFVSHPDIVAGVIEEAATLTHK